MNNDICDLVKIREIKELFDRAEKLAKEVELFQSGVSTPAINQLRYAGQHLLKALVAGSKDDFDKEALKAKGHCQRSMYEASESGIAYAQEAIQEFQRDYSDLVIPEVLPEYTDMMFRADKASEVLAHG